jgi:hypothetical protein
MKAIVGYLLAAVVMAAVGAAGLTLGFLDRDIAHAQEHIITGEYTEPLQIFQKAERYYEYAAGIPWIGGRLRDDMRARQAVLQYWQRRYTAVVPEESDPVANVPADNLTLQLVMANAMFREGLAVATDKATTLGALDAAANGYLTLLRNADRHHDAAYNFEYVTRLRNDVAAGRRKTVPPPSTETIEGAKGAPAEVSATDTQQFKMYVPLDGREQDKAQAGQAAPIRRKG